MDLAISIGQAKHYVHICQMYIPIRTNIQMNVLFW